MSGFPALCLDCGASASEAPACARPGCGGRRIIRHPELHSLEIAHVDCDAFYASIEKRDDPSLADRPVIVGGGVRGVVTTACYIARTYGVRSAMPMFQALRACPDAVVIKPDFSKYAAAAREVRSMMEALTPLVEPVSIDEAFLDLSGTQRLHRMSPAEALAGLQRDIRREIGITVSIGLSSNKFLAKTASDFDKPNGFSVIGAEEAKKVLAPLPVSAIWGVGAVFAKRLNADGLATIGDLQRTEPSILARRYGEMGLRLADLSQGKDRRSVAPSRETKSVSAETTFNADIRDLRELADILWRLSERTAARMKAKNLVGRVVTLKLKSPDFRTITRRATLARPSNLARTLFETARPLLAESWRGRAWRLIGVGYCDLTPDEALAQREMFMGDEEKFRREETAIDAIRKKFGEDAIALGRTYAKKPRRAALTDKDGDDDG
ncbi:MAG: DNA polymerase IV [Pseudomonadota bacterium]